MKEVIRSRMIKLDKSYSFIRRLIREKQHVWNQLAILYEANKYDKDFIQVMTNYQYMRKYYSGMKTPMNTEDKQKKLEYYIRVMKRYNFANQVFQDYYDTYSNKLFVDIIKEFKARLKTNDQLYGKVDYKNRKSYYKMKTKKISKIHSGSITLNSNVVIYNNNIMKLSVFNRNYWNNVLKYKRRHDRSQFRVYINIPDNIKPKNVILVWKSNQYWLHFSYSKEIEVIDNQLPYHLSIDPGQDNIWTIFSDNPKAPSLLIRDYKVKHMNHIYNTVVNKLRQYQRWDGVDIRSKDERIMFHKLNTFETKRELTMRDFAYKISSRIIDYCKKYHIGKIIIGRNKHQKTGSKMSKFGNRRFHAIPHYKFNEVLEYKANENNIQVIYQEESYTSKLCALHPLSQVWKYSTKNPPQTLYGVRENRSTYSVKLDDGKQRLDYNADINGAINILQKYLKQNIDVRSNLGSIFHPMTIRSDMDFIRKLKL